jgi:hypothetical protein
MATPALGREAMQQHAETFAALFASHCRSRTLLTAVLEA